MSSEVQAGVLLREGCTCEAFVKWREGKLMYGGYKGKGPEECPVHPIRIQVGSKYVSCLMRECSALAANGSWYEETTVWHIESDGHRKFIDTYDSLREAVAATFSEEERELIGGVV